MSLTELLVVARGDKRAGLVLKNAMVVDVFSGSTNHTDVAIHNGFIAGLGSYCGEKEIDLAGCSLVPGFIDGHVHIESAMLLPHNFGRTVLNWGTTTVISDPHEIANVLGMEGITLMKASAELSPLEIIFMAPSCVPATGMETSGSRLGAGDISTLLGAGGLAGLAEVMNFPEVVAGNQEVLEKILAAQERPIDGHAPGLTGKALNAYAAAGIKSDHECTTAAEALEKLSAGLHIMIREGSTAKNLEALLPAVNLGNWPGFMLVTDDAHPDELLFGHLNKTLRKAVRLGMDPLTAVRLVTINPARYFNLRHIGAIAPGYQADLVAIDDLNQFNPCLVLKKGLIMFQAGVPTAAAPVSDFPVITAMNVHVPEKPFRIRAAGRQIKCIDLVPGQIITRKLMASPKIIDGFAEPEIEGDILKIAVVERHRGSGQIGLGFVHGFGLQSGALASSVAHDSHNIIVVGTNDRDMERAVQEIINMGGGIAVVREERVTASLSLPVAGLMSDGGAEEVAADLQGLKKAAAELGCPLNDPFMVMSFMSLPVIPELKITDRGLVDVNKFEFTSLFEEVVGFDSDKK